MASFGPNVRIQVLIERPGFRDALYFKPEVYEATTDERIRKAGDERYAAHLAYLEQVKNNPPAPPTEAELVAEKERLLAQVAEIDSRIQGRK